MIFHENNFIYLLELFDNLVTKVAQVFKVFVLLKQRRFSHDIFDYLKTIWHILSLYIKCI